MSDKLIRPRRCWFCREPLYHAGEPRHEPEVRVTVESNHISAAYMTGVEMFYAHQRCWNERMKVDG